MNIFILDNDHQRNAQYHVDSHVVKMPTEAAQMLCTVYRLTHGEKTVVRDLHLDMKSYTEKEIYLVSTDVVNLKGGHLYRVSKKIMDVSFPSHPCTIWAGESVANWLWLRNYALALNKEWRYRYDHTSNHLAINRIIQTPVPDLPKQDATPFALAMPDECKRKDAVESYRAYYAFNKQHLFKWKKRGRPEWLPS